MQDTPRSFTTSNTSAPVAWLTDRALQNSCLMRLREAELRRCTARTSADVLLRQKCPAYGFGVGSAGSSGDSGLQDGDAGWRFSVSEDSAHGRGIASTMVTASDFDDRGKKEKEKEKMIWGGQVAKHRPRIGIPNWISSPITRARRPVGGLAFEWPHDMAMIGRSGWFLEAPSISLCFFPFLLFCIG